MRLDPDCIREILFELEEKCDYRQQYSFPDDADRLKLFDQDFVMYHLRQCEMSGLIVGFQRYMGGSCSIKDLSPAGHEFIADIRSDTNWNKTKDVAKNVGSSSLGALVQIASAVITEMIKKNFGIN